MGNNSLFTNGGAWNSNHLAIRTGSARCRRILDCDPRGGLSRATGLLLQAERIQRPSAGAQVLLHFHLRILFQPLCDCALSLAHPLQAPVRRLAWLPDRRVCPGLGSQSIYELIWSSA